MILKPFSCTPFHPNPPKVFGRPNGGGKFESDNKRNQNKSDSKKFVNFYTLYTPWHRSGNPRGECIILCIKHFWQRWVFIMLGFFKSYTKLYTSAWRSWRCVTVYKVYKKIEQLPKQNWKTPKKYGFQQTCEHKNVKRQKRWKQINEFYITKCLFCLHQIWSIYIRIF